MNATLVFEGELAVVTLAAPTRAQPVLINNFATRAAAWASGSFQILELGGVVKFFESCAAAAAQCGGFIQDSLYYQNVVISSCRLPKPPNIDFCSILSRLTIMCLPGANRFFVTWTGGDLAALPCVFQHS
jgi:hypothetical protein